MSKSEASRAVRSIAMVGKGGVGKTALTVLLTKALVGRGKKILVVDADPVVGLPQALGVKVTKTIGDVSEEIIKAARSGGKKAEIEVVSMLDYMVFETLLELDGFALLPMGKREGEGCFCPVNDILRDALDSLSKSFDVILIDGEAGVEQVNRRVTQRVDTLLIVSDPTVRGVQTAALVNDVAHKRDAAGVTRTGLVITRIRNGQESLLRESAEKMGLEVLAIVPEDENIRRYDLAGMPIYELDSSSPSVVAVREMAGRLGLLT
ncbi:MAG: AAA family ATPase [Chloroflexota bacterium]|nr:AAA family ATPase [Chloroflexota bacterium]